MKPGEEAFLSQACGHGINVEVVAFRRRSKQRHPFGLCEASQLNRFEVGAGPVRRLDEGLNLVRNLNRKAKPDVNCSLEPMFKGAVIQPKCGLERGYHIANHIFAGIVKQGG